MISKVRVMDDRPETRQERRDRKLASRRERMQKHGARLVELYANAVRKRSATLVKPHADRQPEPPRRSAD